ncbi:MAG TPA: carbohydrate ABC transporter permease [Candidatus Acetatifactor stercoripullorum]|uniref:Carbohydrate ABC transporter permease n=1 Tax=Candidatus Acetatifactor stercoripullorum TaxID=2838414 RepID=A0A9D1R4K0_9FIRM|nr:carbohydrate ABC transporter permease [uncultured Acetatifactor sp.]HIW80799.1 carbohydrate ABC transporter permease [Candidatus Acetatifactor stercoripullorum]
MKRMSVSDKVVTIVNYVLCFIIACITAYPLIYVFSMSISRPEAVVSGTVKLLPKGFSLQAFKLVFSNMEVWRSYYNTIWYTVVGTAISVLLTLMAAYPLSRKQFCLRKPLSVFFSISMFFTGTLVPMYLLINNLGLYNTRWAIVLPTGAAAYYIIIARTFFSGISDSLYDSARIDGAGEMKILWKVYMPLSKPVISVLILYYAIQQWNSYFNAMIYLPGRRDLQPLQIYLMKVLINNESAVDGGAMGSAAQSMISTQLKYVVIVVALIPILCVYPFLQKYFTTGMTLGAVKE